MDYIIIQDYVFLVLVNGDGHALDMLTIAMNPLFLLFFFNWKGFHCKRDGKDGRENMSGIVEYITYQYGDMIEILCFSDEVGIQKINTAK